MPANLKLVEEVVGLSLSDKQKKIFERGIEDAKLYLDKKGHWRFSIGNIAINLHNEIFGEEVRWDIDESRVLRSMFAREIGQCLRTIDNWMAIKAMIIDQLPSEKTNGLAYVDLFEIYSLMKSKFLTANQALEKHQSKRQDPNQHRIALMERYSSNLLNSVRKFKFKKEYAEEIKTILERLSESMDRLSGDL